MLCHLSILQNKFLFKHILIPRTAFNPTDYLLVTACLKDNFALIFPCSSSHHLKLYCSKLNFVSKSWCKTGATEGTKSSHTNNKITKMRKNKEFGSSGDRRQALSRFIQSPLTKQPTRETRGWKIKRTRRKKE